jgi:hypothetical protein
MNKRASRRKRLLKAGTIEFGDGAITCIVRNISDTGALLDVATPVGIPHHFTLVLRANGHGMPLLHCKRIIYRGRDDQPRRHPRRAARNRELASRRPADQDRYALHGAQQALRKIFEPDIWHQASQTLPHRQPAKRGRFPASSLDNPAAKEIMTPLTSAQCLAIAVRKIGEATGDRRYGKELEATARAWLVLAERIEQGERLALQDSQCGQEKAQSDVCNLTLNV